MPSETKPAIPQIPQAPAALAQSALDKKLLLHFPGFVVRKDLTHGLKQNAPVPTYVLEYLLGQHCATDEEALIQSGLKSVQQILAKHYVTRNEAELVKFKIKEKGHHKVIDKITVALNAKGGFYEAEFSNLGLKKVPVSDDYVRRYPKLLVGGIWCICAMTYEAPVEPSVSPWAIDELKPIQVANIDHEKFLEARAEFTSDEWIDVLMQALGFNPDMFERRGKLLTLLRLIPYCERNYNLLELGPKGTGKSHVYAEFSPHGMLISGAEVTEPKLFVNNSTGKIGLVGFWECICFDEFAGKDKAVKKNLVDIMKGYMANRTFSRGIELLNAEASLVFMGNTKRSMPYMLKNSNFFEPLPDEYIDSAFLDRLHAYIPGWEVAIIRQDLFTTGYGFIVDYIAEVLNYMRTEDFTGLYKKHFELNPDLSVRDQTAIEKTFSGLMKILHPAGNATAGEIEELLVLALESRRRIREHIIRIDSTFPQHDFSYQSVSSSLHTTVLTPEERQYPSFTGKAPRAVDEEHGTIAPLPAAAPSPVISSPPTPPALPNVASEPKHLQLPENSKGWSYQRLFADSIKGAHKITIRDAYVRKFHQVRNLLEFLRMVHALLPEGDEVTVRLITKSDSETFQDQAHMLDQLTEDFAHTPIAFSWELDSNAHARSIETDAGNKIVLDRGLDIFQYVQPGNLSVEQNVQEVRRVKKTEITYLKL